MKKALTIASLFILPMLLFTSFKGKEQKGSLLIEFLDLKEKEGYLNISIYDSKQNWLKKGKAWATKRVEINSSGIAIAQFDKVPLGEWAAVGYLDLNENNKLDRSFFGKPKEPCAFSRKIQKNEKKPDFMDVKFSFNYSEQVFRMYFQ